MPDPVQPLPARPNLAQYRKQAKELVRACRERTLDALSRIQRHHPRFAHLRPDDIQSVALTDAQLVIAREHGFESWPKFAAEIESLRIARVVAEVNDPVAAFLIAACVPRDGYHGSGTLEEAEAILARFPHVAGTNIYTASILADEATVRRFLAADAKNATATGGAHGWDALTYLCFSRYLRLDRARSEAFVRTARVLLEAGADANTGWWETIDLDTTPRQVPERAIYGAAALAQQPELTRLLLEFGADPNDEETPYHIVESNDNTVMQILLESGRLNEQSLTTILLRETDWHDYEGVQMALGHGANPNSMMHWGNSALHHAVQRDNWLQTLALLVDHGGDVTLKNRHGHSAAEIAAHRGRGDFLALLKDRGIDAKLEGVHRLLAACALADDAAIQALLAEKPVHEWGLLMAGGSLLAHFAGNGNTEGVRRLLHLGVKPDALYAGDGYYEIAKDSTALHVAAWRGRPATARLLIERGAPVNALDGEGRTALQLAIRACVNSFWNERRSPEWVIPLLEAGASIDGIEIPCGYDEVDELLLKVKSSED